MDAQMCKMVTNRKTNHEKKRSRKPAHGNDKTRWNTNPPKLDFRIPSHTESQFQLFHICWDCVPKGTQSPSKLKPAGAFGAKIWYERGLKNTQTKTHQTSKQFCWKCTPKGHPEKLSFCNFLGSGAKGVPGSSQRSPRAPYKVKSCRKIDKKWYAEFDFCDVLLGLVPDWTHMPPGASAVLPVVPGLFQSSHPCDLQRAT